MYSSLAEQDRPQVIQRCYGPLLDLAESGVPISLEATGLTLEIIRGLDPAWLDRLRELMDTGRIQFVGSGYSQIIAPLVPARLNRINWDLGRNCYAQMLGREPEIWLVNEMAWSGGLPEVYRQVGARAVVMEWNNAWKGHPEWSPEFRYHHQMALGCEGSRVPLLWVDTLDFQKFQRMAAGELEVDDLFQLWLERAAESAGKTRFGTLYGSDAEVFDFRPGRYREEGGLRPEGEWKRMAEVFARLKAENSVELVFLGEALKETPSEFCSVDLKLESTSQPIVVKKQEKYNLTRWAVTGRGDLEANSACHRLLTALEKDSAATADQWRELCYLWSSDFRTHITEDRYLGFQKRLRSSGEKLSPAENRGDRSGQGRDEPLTDDGRRVVLSTEHLTCELDLRRGLALRSLVFPLLGPQPVLGTLAHGHFDDIAFGADFYTGHVVVQRPGQPKLSDLQPCAPKTSCRRHQDGSLTITTEIVDGELQVTKEYHLSAHSPVLGMSGSLKLPGRLAGEIHPIHLTVIPGLFAPGKIRFETCNGGLTPEVFSLQGGEVHHGESYSTLITAKRGLGATDQQIRLGDGNRLLTISHDPGVSALMPTVRFSRVRGGDYFLRLRYSAQEVDETFVPSSGPWTLNWSLEIRASREEGLE